MTAHITESRPGTRHWQFIEQHSPQTVRYMSDPNDRGGYRCFVAVDEHDQALGLCIIAVHRLGFGPLADQSVACLENILVLAAARRQGVGSTLLDVALAAAWTSGATYVWWTVEYENPDAIAFYQAHGALFIAEEDPASETPESYYTALIPNPRPTHG